MSVSGIESVGFTPLVTPRLDAASGASSLSGATSSASSAGQSFGDLVVDGLDRLQGVQATSDQLAVKAATGDLNAVHQYTIAASEAAVTTQLTVAVRNKALEAFSEIMRMPV